MSIINFYANERRLNTLKEQLEIMTDKEVIRLNDLTVSSLYRIKKHYNLTIRNKKQSLKETRDRLMANVWYENIENTID